MAEKDKMIVLSRKKNEEIVIYDDIFIKVVDIRKDKVRLGIEAAKEYSVCRGEVHSSIQRGTIIDFVKDENYVGAYELLRSEASKSRQVPISQSDLTKIIDGLRGSGKLIEDMHEFLENYKKIKED